MKKKRVFNNFIFNLIARYLILLIIGLNLWLVYLILTPITLYPVYFLLKVFYSSASVSAGSIFISNYQISLINACIAGSAFYLLLILNLSTHMNSRQRLYSLVYSFSALLILNIARIVILSALFVNNFAFFDITHKLFWYFLSTIFVIAIWFSAVYFFRIKNIPVYSDLKKIRKMIK